MKFAQKTGLAITACFLSIYGCSSGDDDTSPTGQAGMPSGGTGTAAAAGKGSAGTPSTGGSHAGGSGGEAGQSAGNGDAGTPPETMGGSGAGGVSGEVAGQAGREAASAGAAGEDGAGGAAATACIKAISGRYVLRHDDTAVYAVTASDEEVVADQATGSPLVGIQAVADGSYHGCALLADKSVKCWQTSASYGNGEGQLGNGTTAANATTFRATPVLVAADTPLTNSVALASAAPATQATNDACAVDASGKLWCWGDLTWIVNGGASLHTGYAQAVTLDGLTALTGVIQASVARELACALVQGTPNEVWCWGSNTSGELAQGDTDKRQYPVHVLGLTAPSKVVVSVNTACALDGDAVRCWGSNGSSGAVGDKTTTSAVQTPTLVVLENGTTALGGVTELVAGSGSFAALREGAIWIWGTHFANYAANYGITNVSLLGSAGGLSNSYAVRYVTSDEVYHDAMTVLPLTCGPIR